MDITDLDIMEYARAELVRQLKDDDSPEERAALAMLVKLNVVSALQGIEDSLREIRDTLNEGGGK